MGVLAQKYPESGNFTQKYAKKKGDKKLNYVSCNPSPLGRCCIIMRLWDERVSNPKIWSYCLRFLNHSSEHCCGEVYIYQCFCSQCHHSTFLALTFGESPPQRTRRLSTYQRFSNVTVALASWWTQGDDLCNAVRVVLRRRQQHASCFLVGIKLLSRKDILLDDKVGKLHCRLVMSFFSSCFCACIKQRVHIAKHIQYKKALNAVGLSFLSIDCPSPTRQFNMIVVVFGLIFFYCLHLFTTHKMSPTIVCYVYLWSWTMETTYVYDHDHG